MRDGTGGRLFNGALVAEVLGNQERRIKANVQAFEPNYILNVSEEDLVAALVKEYTLDLPTLDESGIAIDYGEQQIDVSGDPMRSFYQSGPHHMSGIRLTFSIPFKGEGKLLYVQPMGFSMTYRASNVEVAGNEIHYTFSGANLNADQAKQGFADELKSLKQNLANLKTSIDRHNDGLPQLIRTQVQQRRQKLLADAKLAASLGFPLRRRDGEATTYAVPITRRAPQIERPAVTAGPFQPEPALAVVEYEQILSIMRNMVRVMEQSPKAFESMGEEDLRTQFLVQLNAQYEGQATGETFNFQGKTDILIRADGKNIFIAECKFWDGEKQFIGTIDQLLSYLSWRDTKAAVLIFNRNVNFTEVINRIAEAVPKHSNFKRLVDQLDESSFRYIFHQPNDPNREVILTVMAFDVPTRKIEKGE
jgi:hypothetical protein